MSAPNLVCQWCDFSFPDDNAYAHHMALEHARELANLLRSGKVGVSESV